jgi:hypothetical protein
MHGHGKSSDIPSPLPQHYSCVYTLTASRTQQHRRVRIRHRHPFRHRGSFQGKGRSAISTRSFLRFAALSRAWA